MFATFDFSGLATMTQAIFTPIAQPVEMITGVFLVLTIIAWIVDGVKDRKVNAQADKVMADFEAIDSTFEGE